MLNQVTQGDCLSLLPLVEDKSVDMVLCDLPYGITQNAWDSVIDLSKLWAEYKRVLRLNGVVVLTAVQPFTSRLVISNLEWFKYSWVWEKTNATGFLNAKRRPLSAHEDVLVFAPGVATYNPQKTHGHTRKSAVKRNDISTNYGAQSIVSYDSTERYPRSVQVFRSDKQKGSLHPTQKPVALFEYLICTYTNKGHTVLDNCCGSGTTGVACQNTGRNFIQMELDPKYCEIARSRLR
jgi:DNA modification methylase